MTNRFSSALLLCLSYKILLSFLISVNISFRLGGRKSSFIVYVPTRRGKGGREGGRERLRKIPGEPASEIGHKFCMRVRQRRGRERGHAFVCGRP